MIRDIGPWDRHFTVTNDAEGVVERLREELAGRRLFYYDSDGDLDYRGSALMRCESLCAENTRNKSGLFDPPGSAGKRCASFAAFQVSFEGISMWVCHHHYRVLLGELSDKGVPSEVRCPEGDRRRADPLSGLRRRDLERQLRAICAEEIMRALADAAGHPR